MRIPHPRWSSPDQNQLTTIIGACLDNPVVDLDVLAEEHSGINPGLTLGMQCQRHPDGEELRTPFMLIGLAGTTRQIQMFAIDTAQLALDSACADCPFKGSVDFTLPSA